MDPQNNNSFGASSALQAHAVWYHGRSGLVASEDSGIIQLKDGVFTFTKLDGNKLLSIPVNQVKKFSAGLVVGRSGGYKFQLETNETPTKRYNFSALYGLDAKIYKLSDDDRANDTIKGGPWLAAFRQAGVKTLDYQKMSFYIALISFPVAFAIFGLIIFLSEK